MDQTDSYPVLLYIYDMSKGMARQLSPVMLGEFLRNYLLSGFMESVDSAPGPGRELRRDRGRCSGLRWRLDRILDV